MHFHKWNKWSELISGYNNEKTQYRVCSVCGKVQFRDLGYCKGTNAEQANKALDKTYV